MLTHYTRTPDAVHNILIHGFGWMPNRRRLTDVLIPQHDFSKREPQQFGMISFTDLPPEQAADHRAQFGRYGVVVTDGWALESGAQRVVYVDEDGYVTRALQVLFAFGYEDVKRRIKYPDDGARLMAYENKHMASVVGSGMWLALLQLWEYMEPASCAAQREWRIVNTQPYYGLTEDKQEAIAQISPPSGWAKFMNVLAVPREGVSALICPAGEGDALLSKLPQQYRDVEVIESGAVVGNSDLNITGDA